MPDPRPSAKNRRTALAASLPAEWSSVAELAACDLGYPPNRRQALRQDLAVLLKAGLVEREARPGAGNGHRFRVYWRRVRESEGET